uniref:Uncharacterized protein n=1 Tax=Candidozyma auris TaxID=498019 RepID=A0A0L0NXT3_CANAR
MQIQSVKCQFPFFPHPSLLLLNNYHRCLELPLRGHGASVDRGKKSWGYWVLWVHDFKQQRAQPKNPLRHATGPPAVLYLTPPKAPFHCKEEMPGAAAVQSGPEGLHVSPFATGASARAGALTPLAP